MVCPEKKFLVAGGEAEEVTLIAESLRNMGYFNVTVLDNGPEALELVLAGGRYFVIAAWELPELGGLRLVREVRRTAYAAGEPCLLIVPENHESELLMSEGVGVSGFLVRPVTEEQVRAKVPPLLDRLPESDWPRALERQADRLADTGRPEEALAEYAKVLEAGRRRLAGLETETGLTCHKLGRSGEAVEHLERAALADPGLARAQSGLGRVYLETGRPAEASRSLERAVRLDPQNFEVKTMLAESLLESGKLGRAEDLFRELLSRRPEDGYLLNRLGIALRKQGKYDRAVAHYLEAIKIKPGDENLFFNLGRSYYESGDRSRALKALEKALEINPDMEQAGQLLSKIRSEEV
ncbi:MAG: tetratricopeptide repeat protein [Thermodesulfobacteriota bacterium]